MKCPKCGYLGFETADRCRNCGYDFSLANGASPGPDLSLKPSSEPLGSLADFKLENRDSVPTAEGRRTFEALDLDRLIGVPGPTTDLPLFPGDKSDKSIDAPMVTAPAVPRTPLAVRRSTPEAPRLRSRTGQVDAPELPIGPAPPLTGPRASFEGKAARQEPAAQEGAGLARRFAAGIVDAVILFGIDVAVIYFTLRLCDLRVDQFGTLPIAPLIAFLLLLNGGYSVAFTAVGGQTIGKMALGIKVVGEANRPIDVSHATLRTFTYLVSWLPLGLGLLPALIGHNRRALHDRVANTQVVQVVRP